ncbi:MAG: indolepyruvate oxidoreductase subunit beta [Clostridiales bacterium]|nr:indolepyruvate oxidoreductase subunit beta [Clostridiales bacterium]
MNTLPKESNCVSVVLAGVGGQGTLVAGKLLGTLAMKVGLDVKVSEVHGMSQRGGSVITYVRMGCKVFSPIIDEAMADYCLFFEPLEALRWVSLLKKGGTMIINNAKVMPLPVLLGNESYPQDISDIIVEASADRAEIIEIAARESALSVGSAKATNMVMLGALSVFMDIPQAVWEESIRETFSGKPDFIPMNIKAFRIGRDAAR